MDALPSPLASRIALADTFVIGPQSKPPDFRGPLLGGSRSVVGCRSFRGLSLHSSASQPHCSHYGNLVVGSSAFPALAQVATRKMGHGSRDGGDLSSRAAGSLYGGFPESSAG